MSSDIDIARMSAGANAVTVLSSGDGVRLTTPGAYLSITGRGTVEMQGSEPVSAAQVQKVVDDSVQAGEEVIEAALSGTEASVEMKNGTWLSIPSSATSVVVTAASTPGRVFQTHLILTPADTMSTGWLTAADGAVVRWPFGEIAMPAGWSYIITLVQVGKVILANALPVDLSTPAA